MSNQTYFQDEWLEEDKFSLLVAECLMLIKKQNVKFVERALCCLTQGEGL